MFNFFKKKIYASTIEFRNLSMEECLDLHIFCKYFNNISFNRFIKNITELMEFRILEERQNI